MIIVMVVTEPAWAEKLESVKLTVDFPNKSLTITHLNYKPFRS